MIKPSNLIFLWFREQLQCRKPPVGYFFPGFHKAARVIAPGVVLSYFHKTYGSEGGQALIDKSDCTFLWPVSRYISLFATSCSWKPLIPGAQHAALLLFTGEQWKMQGDPGIAWEMRWVYKMGFSEHHFSLSCCCFKQVNSLRSSSAVSLLFSVAPRLPGYGRNVLPWLSGLGYVTGLTCEKNCNVSLASVTDPLCCFGRDGESKHTDGCGSVGGRAFMKTFYVWETLVITGTGQLNTALGAKASGGLERERYLLIAINEKKICWGSNVWGDKR